MGTADSPFTAADLVGNWDGDGTPGAPSWATVPMHRLQTESGDVAFEATVDLRPVPDMPVRWGVRLHRADGSTCWGIFAEVDNIDSTAQHRTFVLDGESRPPRQEYRLSNHRRMGAVRLPGVDGASSALRFSVWAPNARAVEVVFGGPSGYIADDGHGADPAAAPVPLTRSSDGVWTGEVADHAEQLGRRYMYRITCDDGSTSWANDMYSRQAGSGMHDPRGAHFDGAPEDLDGTPSCSVVVDPTGSALISTIPRPTPLRRRSSGPTSSRRTGRYPARWRTW